MCARPTTTQIVFLDTPGVHKPRTLLGERTNERALVDARRGRRRLLPDRRERADRAAATASSPSSSPRSRTPVVLVVNKVDRASREQIVEHLASASGELGDFAAFVPLSARTGDGVDALRRRARGAAARGSALLPRRRRHAISPRRSSRPSCCARSCSRSTRDELPHSIAVTAEEVEERDDQGRAAARVARGRARRARVAEGDRDRAGAARCSTPGRHRRPAASSRRCSACGCTSRPTCGSIRDWQRRASSLDRLGL